jgi:hypothetical protein
MASSAGWTILSYANPQELVGRSGRLDAAEFKILQRLRPAMIEVF